jgi:hypothetical protein
MPEKKSFTFSITLVAGLFLAGLFSNVLMTKVQAASVWKSRLPGSQAQVYSHLDVIINEVAWSGTVSASVSEWIELYNPGGVDIDLSGWKLVSDDGVPNISLTGEIRSGDYYLLERNDDMTIIDIKADLIFAEGLDNKGEVLRLLAPDGKMIDSANLGVGKWSAGTSFPDYASMERISVIPDSPSAWGNNNGVIKNGFDLKNKPIRGTPRQRNSLYVTPIETDTNTPESTLTDTATKTNTATPTQTFSPTPTLPAPNHLVISQFRTRGPAGAEDEFVELFNPGNAPVNIGGWQIKKSSDCGQVVVSLLTIPPGVVLLSGQRYLAVSQSSGLATPDQTFSLSISDGGGLALVQSNGNIVDQVGLCSKTQFHEGMPLLPISGNYNQAYFRRPSSGMRGCVDTNRNSDDFYLLSPSNPQGMAAPIELCPGVLTATPTLRPEETITQVAGEAVLVINEFLPHPASDWNGDGSANVYDEFIEIMNIGLQPVNLNGWMLDDNESGSNIFSLPEIILLPGEIILFYGEETGLILNDIGDKVRLMKPNAQVVDTHTYPTVTKPDQSWCRQPDGIGAWRSGCQPTPDRLNKWLETVYASPLTDMPEHPVERGRLICPFAESLLMDHYQSRCIGWGENIYSRSFWKPEGFLLLTGGDKWGVMIH